MSFWRKISPSGAVRDFAHEFTRPNPYRWPVIGVSLAATFTLFSVMWQEGGEGPPPRPEITYITTFAPHRSDTEIAASNAANQARNDKLAAEQAARAEKVKDIYRTLGRVSGMDVDKIEKQAAEERATEERAAADAHNRLMGRENAPE
ncbi:MAG: hypothetical protein E6R09_17760 [Rhodocyclaceae bacterium]|nr:MAG: hypothetical protein E6R09_17760 [Rhodocyclaceae bacterium]